MKKLVFAAVAAMALVSVGNVFAGNASYSAPRQIAVSDTDTVVTDTSSKPSSPSEQELTICFTDTVDTVATDSLPK